MILIAPSWAETPEEKGLAIAQEADRRDSGFDDYVVDGVMTLISRSGSTAEREFVMKTLERENEGDWRLAVFMRPRDVRGTVVLTYTHGIEPDDQWVFLPAVRRTKRLASRDKTGSFMGSEFSFEDIGTRVIEKYRYKYLGDEAVDGHPTFILQEEPVYEFSGYSKLIEYLDKEIYQPRKIVYFDRQGRELKTLTFHDYNQYLNRYWRPNRVVMQNTQNGNKSVIEWSNYRFRTGLDGSEFSPTVLANLGR